MSELQTELNTIQLKEKEAQKEIAYLTQQLDAERRSADLSKLKVRIIL